MATYYISPTGSDANPGTFASPWATANHALLPDDVVYYRGGSYNRQLVPISSGTDGHPITFLNYPSEVPLLQGITATSGIVTLINRSWITIRGINVTFNPAHADPPFTSGTSRWAWVDIGGNSTGITIDDCNIIKNTFANPSLDYNSGYRNIGIRIGGTAQFIIIKNCQIKGINKGIQTTDSAQKVLIRNNCISQTIQSGIVIQAGTLLNTLKGLQIEGNLIEQSFMEDGIQFQQSVNGANDCWGAVIRYNVFRNHGENALDLKGARFVNFEWNTVYGIYGSNNGFLDGAQNRNSLFGIIVGGTELAQDIHIRNNVFYNNPMVIDAESAPFWTIHNNTMLYNNHDYTGADSTYDPGGSFSSFSNIYLARQGAVSNHEIFNNIAGGARAAQGAYGLIANPIRIDRNIYFSGVGGANTIIEQTAGSYVERTFAAWQTYLGTLANITGKDAGSSFLSTLAAVGLTSVPDKPTGVHTLYDFKPTPSSPAYKTGYFSTKTVGAGTTSTTMVVANAHVFATAFGCEFAVSPDPIYVNGQRTRIVSINYGTNVLTLNPAVTWTNNQDVFLGYNGTPHIGVNYQDYELITLPDTEIQFTDTTSDCTPTAWLWEYSANGGASWTTFATSQNPLYAIQDPGEYSIRLTVTCSGSPVVVTKNSMILVI